MKTFSRKIFTLSFYQSAVILSIYNLIFLNVLYIILYMRNKKGITALILAVILVFTSLTSCKRRDYADFTAFASPVHIEVYGKTLSEETVKEIRELFALLENEFSLSVPDSFTSRLNALQAGVFLETDEYIDDLFEISAYCHDFTDGKFDPTVLPFTKLWRFYPDFPVYDFTPPSADEIMSILSDGITGFNNIIFENGDKVFKKNTLTELDFGGILKGYAADKAAEILKKYGHSEGYVNVGGSSLYILGTDSLSVKHPRKEGNIVQMNIKGKNDLSVSTSGDYEKTYSYEGKTYCHIIDPESGSPAATNVASVTITGIDGGVSDALTTALCLCAHNPDFPLAPEKSKLVRYILKILDAYKDATIFAVYDDGIYRQIITNADKSAYTLLDADYSVYTITVGN